MTYLLAWVVGVCMGACLSLIYSDQVLCTWKRKEYLDYRRGLEIGFKYGWKQAINSRKR